MKNQINSSSSTITSSSSSFITFKTSFISDPYTVVWITLLFLLGCGPTWGLIIRAEHRWQKYRSVGLYQHTRTHLDLLYIWGRRMVTLNAGFYFMTALSLTPPELFVKHNHQHSTTNLTLLSFLSRDMLALKHVMHACFFWAGHASFWKNGNCHPMEICRAIFLLTIFPNITAFVTSIYNAYHFEGMSNLMVSTCGLVLSSMCCLLTWLVLQQVYDNGTPKTSSFAISTVRDRYRAALNRMPSILHHPIFWNIRSKALFSLGLHVVVLGCKSLYKMQIYSQMIQPEIFIENYVEAISFGLHWGFVIGSGIHGVRWCSLTSLYMYTWGSFLLLLAIGIDLFWNATPSWINGMEVVGHLYCVYSTLRFQMVLKKNGETAWSGYVHHTHHSEGIETENQKKRKQKWNEGRGFSLWEMVQVRKVRKVRKDTEDKEDKENKENKEVRKDSEDGEETTLLNSPVSLKYYFYGGVASYFAAFSIAILICESVAMPWLVANNQPYNNNNIHLTGAKSSNGDINNGNVYFTAICVAAVSGMNFSLHACSVYYFIFYRAVALIQWDDKSSGSSNGTMWSCSFCTALLGFVSLAQAVCCFLSNASGSSTITYYVFLFNMIRGISFLITSISFKMFPSNECWKIAERIQQERNQNQKQNENEYIHDVDEVEVIDGMKEKKHVNTMKEIIYDKDDEKEEEAAGGSIVQGICRSCSNVYTFEFFEGTSHEGYGAYSDVTSRIAFYGYLVLGIYVTHLLSTSTSTSFESSESAANNNTITSSSHDSSPEKEELYDLGQHSLMFGIVYHFLFITFGYALRGTRVGHNGYKSMGAATTFSFGLCSISTFLKLVTSFEFSFGVIVFLVVGGINVTLGILLILTPSKEMPTEMKIGRVPAFMI